MAPAKYCAKSRTTGSAVGAVESFNKIPLHEAAAKSSVGGGLVGVGDSV